MAIQVNGTQVIGNSRELTNIASVDATTAAAIGAAGVGGASGEQAFTAGEALSAGDVLGLRSDGKVVKRSVILGAETLTYDDEQNEQVYYGAWDEDNEFFIYGIGYYGSGGSRRIGYAVGQVNADKSVSTSSALYTAPSDYSRHLGMAYDTNANKVVVYLFDNGTGNNRGRAAVGTVNSNKTISFGSLTDLPFPSESYYSRGMCFDPSTNKCVFIGSSGPYDYDLRVCVGTVSGNSISFGSVTTVSGTAGTAVNERQAIHIPGASKNLVIWQENRNNKTQIIARSTTISGTSLTFGSEGSVAPSGNFQAEGFAVVADPTSGSSKFLAVSFDTSSYEICGYVGTLSGTSVSFGPKIVLAKNSDFAFASETNIYIRPNTLSLSQVPGGNNLVLGFQVWSSQFRRVFTKPLSISGTSLVEGVNLELNKVDSTIGEMIESKAFLLPDYKENVNVMVSTKDQNNKKSAYSQVLQGSPAQFIGIAAENISSGSSGQVTVLGGINTNLSGLSTGATYGMKLSSGDLSAFPTDSEERVGRAISSTSLYIDTGFGENN